ncbi:Uncharacterised protein [Mycoplasmopsis synoviae]|uniref:Uncharacterized protein n=1 Tax=Mycoplasmopsis synoviae TaxID=2109 RepID=A0A3B0P8Q9_MYCSY|nr:Uncharacterised protein [Mycoplasmopsis synoviae]
MYIEIKINKTKIIISKRMYHIIFYDEYGNRYGIDSHQ